MINFIKASIALALVPFSSALDLQCKNNLVHYWGQNSFGAINLNNPAVWEKDLSYYCDLDVADVFVVSFLNVFNAGTGKYPELNFANHCETFFDEEPAKKLRNCPKIGQDIKYCQSKGKTILLSLGGATAQVGFPSAPAAEEFADTLWNMFFKGTHKFRPFGDANPDGFDLDIEGGSQAHYDVFVKKMRQYFATDSSKKYYVGAAPQCVFPDAHLQTTMETSHMDMIFIQFYNNWCGVQNYDNIWAWNWKDWENWAKTKSYNKDVRLYLGVPAGPKAAGSGYIDLDKLKRITGDLKTNATFGGLMMWESSQSDNNVVGGQAYGKVAKNFLNTAVGCSPKPTTSSSVPSSSTTTASTTNPPSSTTTTTNPPSSTTTTTTIKTTTSTEVKTTTTTTVTQSTTPPGSCTKPTCADAGKSALYYDCVFNKPVQRSCGSGTVCRQNTSGVYCDFP